MRWLALAALVLSTTGCGGSKAPTLAHSDASPLIALAKQIAGESACAQSRDIPKLQHQAIALVDARRVPAALQETMLSGVQALAAEVPVCLPSTPVTTTTTTPVATRTPPTHARPHPPHPHPPHPGKPGGPAPHPPGPGKGPHK